MTSPGTPRLGRPGLDVQPRRIAVAGATGLVGAQVVALAGREGHHVVGLSRGLGVDLTDPRSLGNSLLGVDAVIDVTRSPSMEEQQAVGFFTTVATHLGAAAWAAGVRRTVVLSIVGADRSQDYGWYVATQAHEETTRAHAPGPRVLRATQFHEFPGQVLDRSLRGGRAEVLDMPTQPVDSAEVARLLVKLATEEGGGDVEVAGPRPEHLGDLVRRLAGLRGEEVDVVSASTPSSIAGGSLLPGPEALRRGVDWDTWASRQSYDVGPEVDS